MNVLQLIEVLAKEAQLGNGNIDVEVLAVRNNTTGTTVEYHTIECVKAVNDSGTVLRIF